MGRGLCRRVPIPYGARPFIGPSVGTSSDELELERTEDRLPPEESLPGDWEEP